MCVSVRFCKFVGNGNGYVCCFLEIVNVIMEMCWCCVVSVDGYVVVNECKCFGFMCCE